MTTNNKKGISGKTIAAIGASAAALGATAYYFWGPKGKQHLKSAKKWTVEAKKQIIKEIKKGKEITKAAYDDIVDTVVNPYVKKGATRAEVQAMVKALKEDWKHIVKASKSSVKKAVGEAKKDL